MRLDVAFNLDFSLCCGQVFRWRKLDGWWYGVIGENVCKIRQVNCELEFENVSERFVGQYFGLDYDLAKITRHITKDNYIQKALHRFEGLRIVRQNPWECLISFICATYKSIAAIEQMLQKISLKYGERRLFDGLEFHIFPSVEQLALASEDGLRECGLGYRARYVQTTARKIRDENINLESFKAMSYSEARKALLEFDGVGLKVADCILLFSLEKLEAFPVDVWIKRVILKHYSEHFPAEFIKKMQSHNSLTNGEYQKIGDFARSYFSKYAGYAQEYLYHYERTQQ